VCGIQTIASPCCTAIQAGNVAAWDERCWRRCVRDPDDRIALLYCNPGRQRRGLGRALLEAAEQQAIREGHTLLRTEASLISRPLFETMGWQVSWREDLRIGGVHFHRFRLHKRLQQRY